jgi:hypothetical protein
VLAACLYAGVLVASAAHHHALASPGKSSSHCTICQVVSIVRPQALPLVIPAPLAPAGSVSLERETRGMAVSRLVLAGRSPPAVG